jgi:hypothetical protein
MGLEAVVREIGIARSADLELPSRHSRLEARVESLESRYQGRRIVAVEKVDDLVPPPEAVANERGG